MLKPEGYLKSNGTFCNCDQVNHRQLWDSVLMATKTAKFNDVEQKKLHHKSVFMNRIKMCHGIFLYATYAFLNVKSVWFALYVQAWSTIIVAYFNQTLIACPLKENLSADKQKVNDSALRLQF